MISNFDSNNCLIINYFLTYDFLSKYNLNSIHQIPKLKKISLEVFSNDILKIYEIDVNKYDIEVQLMSFFFTYIFNGTIPFINYSKIRRSNEANFWLKIFLSSYNIKLMFLKSLLIEKRIQQLYLIAKEKNNFKYKTINENKFILKVKVSTDIFSGISLLLNKYFSDINSDRFLIELSFFFNKSIFKENKVFRSNSLRNILLMWKGK